MCVPPSRWPFLRRSRFECRSSMKYQTRSTLCQSPTPVARGTPCFVSLPGDTSKNLGCQLRLPVCNENFILKPTSSSKESTRTRKGFNTPEPFFERVEPGSSCEGQPSLRTWSGWRHHDLPGRRPVRSSVCSKLHGYREPDVAPFLA